MMQDPLKKFQKHQKIQFPDIPLTNQSIYQSDDEIKANIDQ